MNSLDDWGLTILLADSAQVAEGKLYMLGAGWQAMGPQPSPTALVMIIGVPWGETNRKHKVEAVLLSSDGHAVSVPTLVGVQTLQIVSEFEVGRPPGSTPGTKFNVPIPVNLAPLPLSPGRYEWVCSIDGKTRDDWRISFEFRS